MFEKQEKKEKPEEKKKPKPTKPASNRGSKITRESVLDKVIARI